MSRLTIHDWSVKEFCAPDVWREMEKEMSDVIWGSKLDDKYYKHIHVGILLGLLVPNQISIDWELETTIHMLYEHNIGIRVRK